MSRCLVRARWLVLEPMSIHPLNAPQFYLTSPSPCPYLAGREERKVFTHLIGAGAPRLHGDLSQGGFRRSQNIAYRPACERCQACTPVRVLAQRFEPTRSMKRVLKRNDDLVGEIVQNAPTSEQYSLFRRYIDVRHTQGGMAAMTVLDYAMMVEDSHIDTFMIEYRRRGADSGVTGRGEGPLVAVALTDRMPNGLSMVYSFYDPQEAERSLGTFLILDHLRRARAEGLDYCHLGYWIERSPKMAYKARFLPQERLGPTGWREYR